MNKKVMITIVAVFAIVLILILLTNKKEKAKVITETEDKTIEQGIVKYDEETELYYIRDNETNEIVAASKFEEDLEFYKEHPDYKEDPMEVRSTDLHDFIMDEEEIEETE